jgi:hypothetical protein
MKKSAAKFISAARFDNPASKDYLCLKENKNDYGRIKKSHDSSDL